MAQRCTKILARPRHLTGGLIRDNNKGAYTSETEAMVTSGGQQQKCEKGAVEFRLLRLGASGPFKFMLFIFGAVCLQLRPMTAP